MDDRKNLRRIVIPHWITENLDLDDIVELMVANGFTFLSTECPIVLVEPRSVSTDDEAGTTTYEQWDR